MKICYLKIKNFKSIRELEIKDIENALILVGKNNTGKTAVIDALLLVANMHKVEPYEWLDKNRPIEISIQIEFTKNDLSDYHTRGIISKMHSYEAWFEEFQAAFPSFQDNIISFTCQRMGLLSLVKPFWKLPQGLTS